MSETMRCYRCLSRRGDCGSRHWLIAIDGFDDMVQPAANKAQARWRNYTAGREAGYFSGGFRAYLARLSSITEVLPHAERLAAASPFQTEEAKER